MLVLAGQERLGVMCWPSAFPMQGKTLLFPGNTARDFIARRASQAMCVLANLRQLLNSQDCSHSLHTYCCTYSHTHRISQERAEGYPKQMSVWTILARRHGPSYRTSENASLPATTRISCPLAFLHYFLSQKSDDCVHLCCRDSKPTWVALKGKLTNLTNYISGSCSSQRKMLFLKRGTFVIFTSLLWKGTVYSLV